MTKKELEKDLIDNQGGENHSLVIIRELPGSGKTTLAKKMLEKKEIEENKIQNLFIKDARNKRIRYNDQEI